MNGFPRASPTSSSRDRKPFGKLARWIATIRQETVNSSQIIHKVIGINKLKDPLKRQSSHASQGGDTLGGLWSINLTVFRMDNIIKLHK